MSLHRNQVQDDNHAVSARTYADIAARDADVAFHGEPLNVDKKVRVESPPSYYMLFAITPLWLETSLTTQDEFIELLDTPNDYTGQAGLSLQVNAGETAIEFGQALRPADSPTFASLTIGASDPFSDAAGVLTLQNVDVLDAVTEATIEAAIDALANLATIQGQSISLSGSLTVEAASVLNQDLTTDASPTFASLTIGSSVPFADAAGVLTLQNVDAIDAVTEATLEAAIDSLVNLTAVGVLNSGSITSGFGTISIGSSVIFSGILVSTSIADNGFSSNLRFQKSRDGAIVQDNDELGYVAFHGSNGATFDRAALILGRVDGTPGASGDMPGELQFSTTPEGSSAVLRRMSIRSDGTIEVLRKMKLEANDAALGLNVLTTTQRDATTPSAGDLIFNSTTSLIENYDGTSWISAVGGDVSKIGIPVDNEIGVWTGDGSIEGTADFQFDASTSFLSIGNDADTFIGGGGQGGLLQLDRDGPNLIVVSSHGGANAPGMSTFASGGTFATPTATLLGDDLMFLGGRGYDGSAHAGSSGAAIIFLATENQTPSAEGSKILLETTSIGDIFRTERMSISSTIEVRAPMDIFNGTARVKFVFQQSDFGDEAGGEILLTSQTHYVPVGQIVLTATLAVPTDGIVAIGALAPMIPASGSAVPGTTLVFASGTGVGIKADGDDLNNGTLIITNMVLAAATDAHKIINVKSTNKENGAVIMDRVVLSGGQGFDIDNISVVSGTIVQFEPQLSNTFDVTDTAPVGNGALIFDVEKWNIFKADTAAVPGLDFFEVIGAWSTFSLGSAIVQIAQTDEAVFNIDSGATFNAFNVRGVNVILAGGVAFRTGSLDQTTLTFSDNIGVPNSTISAEINLSGNTAVTDIPFQGAFVEIATDVNWIATDIERLSVAVDGSVELTALASAKLKIDGNINIEPANSSKSLSVRTVLIEPTTFDVTFTNATNRVQETAHSRVLSDTISFHDTPGTMPVGLRTDVVYYLVNVLTDSYQLAYTPLGIFAAFTTDGTGTNSYKVASLHGSTPTNTISAGSPVDMIPQATVPALPGSTSFIVVRNNDDAGDITVNNGYQRYFE